MRTMYLGTKNTSVIQQKMIYAVNGPACPLTIGKEYTIMTYPLEPIYNGFEFVFVEDDNNSFKRYPKNWFMTKEEYRNNRLEELGI